VASKQEGGLGQVSSAQASFTVAPPSGSVQYGHMDYAISGALGVSNFIYFYNWTTLKWDLVKKMVLSPANLTGVGQVSIQQIAQYVNPTTREAKVMVRAISPQHLTTPATSFTLKIDYLAFVREEI